MRYEYNKPLKRRPNYALTLLSALSVDAWLLLIVFMTVNGLAETMFIK